MPQTLALAVGHRSMTHSGVTAKQLLENRGNAATLSAAALERWLIDAGFAERADVFGRLVPTELGNWVGGTLGFLGE